MRIRRAHSGDRFSERVGSYCNMVHKNMCIQSTMIVGSTQTDHCKMFPGSGPVLAWTRQTHDNVRFLSNNMAYLHTTNPHGTDGNIIVKESVGSINTLGWQHELHLGTRSVRAIAHRIFNP